MSSEESHRLMMNQLTYSPNKQLLDMIHAINTIGVIGGVQLSRMFLNGKKKQLKKLYSTRIIKKHELQKDKQTIDVYTLGKTSLDYLKEEENTWYTLSEMDVIERILFFQLYERFVNGIKNKANIAIEKAPYPFVGRLVIESMSFLILVVRNNQESIKKYLEKVRPSERVICICEHASDLVPLNDHLKKLSIRVTTDLDMKNAQMNEMFYVWGTKSWIKESLVHAKKATGDG